jgi:hypothetical protein
MDSELQTACEESFAKGEANIMIYNDKSVQKWKD